MRWSAAQALAWIIRQEPLKLPDWTTEMGPKIEQAAKSSGPPLVPMNYMRGAESAGTLRESEYREGIFACRGSK